MASRKIHEVGDPCLAKVCRPVTEFNDRLHELLDDMAETLEEAGGVGLAAPQVGILRRVCIVEDEQGELIELINPVITFREGTATDTEGCLSVPGIYGEVERAAKVKVEFLNRRGKKQHLTATGLLARCVQHELDHLDGITLFERLSPLDRLAKLEEYKAAVERGAKPGEC